MARPEVRTVAAASLVALPGLLAGKGGVDPMGLLAWLVLVAPAAGFACGARGVRIWPLGAVAPVAWGGLWVAVLAAAGREVAEPLWPALVWGGLFLGGLGVGALLPGRAWGGAGLLVLAGLVAAGLCVQGGLAARDAASLASTHPGLAAWLVELSPLAIAFDSAGWDWVHANPLSYRLSGIEWFQRTPHDGRLAGPVVGVVGCALAAVLPRLAFRRARGAEGKAVEGID